MTGHITFFGTPAGVIKAIIIYRKKEPENGALKSISVPIQTKERNFYFR